MLKRITAICLAVALVPFVQAQDAEPAGAAQPVINRAVMMGDEVVRILEETVDWYRMLGVQQQSATQPSDLLILYANRQAADRVVALAFELARANAELLSSQAELQEAVQADASGSPLALQRELRDLDARASGLEAEIAAAQRQLGAAEAQERSTAPVTRVVNGAKTWPGGVGDLVVLEPRVAEPPVGLEILLGDAVIGEGLYRAARGPLSQRSPGFDRQRVQGEVLWLERDRGIEIGAPVALQ